MRVWIDQDLCTGAGVCEDLVPEVFVLIDGVAHVRDPSSEQGYAIGHEPVLVPAGLDEAVVEAAYDCPGSCIFIDA